MRMYREETNGASAITTLLPKRGGRPRVTLTISATIALRDDQPTERVMVTKIYFFSLSLFQSKDEPEGRGLGS